VLAVPTYHLLSCAFDYHLITIVTCKQFSFVNHSANVNASASDNANENANDYQTPLRIGTGGGLWRLPIACVAARTSKEDILGTIWH